MFLKIANITQDWIAYFKVNFTKLFHAFVKWSKSFPGFKISITRQQVLKRRWKLVGVLHVWSKSLETNALTFCRNVIKLFWAYHQKALEKLHLFYIIRKMFGFGFIGQKSVWSVKSKTSFTNLHGCSKIMRLLM